MLATEGDTKVGAGQSRERGLSRQTENDHHTVLRLSDVKLSLARFHKFSSLVTPPRRHVISG